MKALSKIHLHDENATSLIQLGADQHLYSNSFYGKSNYIW